MTITSKLSREFLSSSHFRSQFRAILHLKSPLCFSILEETKPLSPCLSMCIDPFSGGESRELELLLSIGMEFHGRSPRGGLVQAQVDPIHATRADQSLSSSLERISGLLSRWSALKMAVQYEWGGPDSFKKYEKLVSDIASWFSQPSEGYPNAEDLENLLHERLLLSFNTEIEDGSIEEVAEELMMAMSP